MTNPDTKKKAIFTTWTRWKTVTGPCASRIEIPASDGMKYAVSWKRHGHIDTRRPASRARMLVPVTRMAAPLSAAGPESGGLSQ